MLLKDGCKYKTWELEVMRKNPLTYVWSPKSIVPLAFKFDIIPNEVIFGWAAVNNCPVKFVATIAVAENELTPAIILLLESKTNAFDACAVPIVLILI